MRVTTQPPRLLELEVTNQCNLKCCVCCHGDPNYAPQPPHHLTLCDFTRILDHFDYPLPTTVQFCGTGEPTLNHDLCEMIKYTRQRPDAKSIEVFSNAILLDTALGRRLAESGMTLLKTSLDGPDDESFFRHRGCRLGPIVENLATFNKTTGLPIWVNCVVTRLNIDKLDQLPALIDTFGARHLELRLFEGGSANRSRLKVHDNESLREIREFVAEQCEARGIEQRLWDPDETKAERCRLQGDAHVNCWGYLTPCFNLPGMCVDKLGEKPFSVSWQSMRESFQQRIRNGRDPTDQCNCVRAISTFSGKPDGANMKRPSRGAGSAIENHWPPSVRHPGAYHGERG